MWLIVCSKYLDSHLKPYRCKVPACMDAQLQFSSNACLFRHEREAHGFHGHGDNPHLCLFELGPLLPKSIRHLCLREDLRCFYDFEWEQDEVNDLIRKFISNWRAYTPGLKSITWRLWDQNYSTGWEEFQEDLRKACADAGLTLEIVVDDLGTGLWSRECSSFEGAVALQ